MLADAFGKDVSIAGHPVVVIVVEVAFEYCIQYNILLSDFCIKNLIVHLLVVIVISFIN